MAGYPDLASIPPAVQQRVALLSGWKFELFGEQAVKLLQGRTALALTPDRIACVSVSHVNTQDEVGHSDDGSTCKV